MVTINCEIGRLAVEKYLRIQSSIFGNFKGIDLSQESMRKLYDIYLNKNLMPSIMREFDPITQNLVNRPNFVAQDNTISVLIGTGRIDIVTDISSNDNILDKCEFINKSNEFFNDLFESFQLSANRMSFIIEGIIKMLSPDEVQIYMNKFLNNSHIYHSEKIFEWSCNSVSVDNWDIGSKKEQVNLNIKTEIRRMNVQQNGQPTLLNGLVLTQDLNTLAENTSERLVYQDIANFLKIADDKSETIRQVIEKE